MPTPPLSNNTQGSNTDQNTTQPTPATTTTASTTTTTAPTTTPAGASPSPADIDKMVASYLQKKGYKATEAIFIRESNGDTVSLEDVGEGAKKKENTATTTTTTTTTKDDTVPTTKPTTTDTSNVVEPEKKEESTSEPGDPDAYHVSYKSLRQWIENSLDWYKVKKK